MGVFCFTTISSFVVSLSSGAFSNKNNIPVKTNPNIENLLNDVQHETIKNEK